jgi:hypothetical protein
MSRFTAMAVASLLAVGFGSVPADAGLLLDLNPGGTSAPCISCGNATGQTYGWAFNVDSPVTIDGIGFWDEGGDGLETTVQAGLWTSTGTLLASATITDGSTPVASASLSGRWLFESVAVQTLAVGSYVVGGTFFSTVPLAQVDATFVTNPDISGVAGRRHDGADTGFAAPLDVFTSAIFGPTLRTVESVPEPAPLGLMALAAAGVVATASRRRKRNAA